MQRSESLKEIAPALAKAQSQVKPAMKDSSNPFFKSKYADFSSIIDACEEALAANGLAILQAPISNEHGAGVETMLLHSSGEFIAETLILPVAKNDAQGMGSCITYARRYAIEGFMRIRREDDDGNAAAQSIDTLKKETEKALKSLRAAVPNGTAALQEVWSKLSNDMRKAVLPEWPNIKAAAAKNDRQPGEEAA